MPVHSSVSVFFVEKMLFLKLYVLVIALSNNVRIACVKLTAVHGNEAARQDIVFNHIYLYVCVSVNLSVCATTEDC